MIFNPQYRLFKDLPEPAYVTFSSPNSFTIEKANTGAYYMWDGTVYYSSDAETWDTWDGSSISAASNGENYNLYFRGSNVTHLGSSTNTSAIRACRWIITGSNVSVSGDIENLLDYQTVQSKSHPTMGDYCFVFWLAENTSITSVSGLLLTPSTLSTKCYGDMFSGCSNLTNTPALPSKSLATYCYSNMFKGCNSLTTAPTLPATTMYGYCYSSMFKGCNSLTTAPSLPATTLAESCYQNMFENCSALTTPPATLPANALKQYCYAYMFYGCSSLLTVPTINATTVAKSCCASMFRNCISITTAKRLGASNVGTNESGYMCYTSMFYGCSNLEVLPSINYSPRTYDNPTPNSCFSEMFYNCPKIKISITKDSEYTTSYIYGQTNSYSFFYNMFYGTGGSFTGTPSGNRYYYTSNQINTEA